MMTPEHSAKTMKMEFTSEVPLVDFFLLVQKVRGRTRCHLRNE